MFKFIDLFAGIGGFRIALEKLGGECVFSSEFDDKARETYIHNYGEPLFGDITMSETKSYIPHSFDVLCGGFPCQPFSIAGKMRGFEDTRGTLFFDIAQIVGLHRPKVVFLENVRNLLTHDNGNTFAVIKQTLEDFGYKVFFKVLNATEYADIPQNRERLFIVAFDPVQVSDYKTFEFPQPMPLKTKVTDLLDKDVPEKYYYRKGKSKIYDLLAENVVEKGTVYQWRRQTEVRTNKSGVCPALIASIGEGGNRVPIILDDDGIRKLTPNECRKLFGFPDTFKFPSNLKDNMRYKQIGNSVVVPLIERIMQQILKVL